jgi:predicted dehydrogenase
MARKIRMGMVGGGRGAFIGAVHRMAAALDGQIELVCGAFSSSAENSRQTGEDLFLDPSRVYGSFEEMIKKEAALPADVRMDFISIVTPNHVHFEPARLALENGFHVICDKPLCFSMDEALQLKELVEKSNLIFGLTHTYTGYPMVKEARHMVSTGKLGKITKVVVEYPQGWLAQRLEESGSKQASWRTDPSRSGKAGCMGDIGTHAENLVEYITGLEIQELCADLSKMVEGRLLDDDGSVFIRYSNGAKGLLFASQISTGDENSLRIRIYGEKGGIEWAQEEPNTLLVKWADKPKELVRAGGNFEWLSSSAKAHCRTPSGHPEGYLEAFANLYRNFAYAIQARLEGKGQDPMFDFPSIYDGIKGMAFIDAVVEAGYSDVKWHKFPDINNLSRKEKVTA